MRAPPCLRPHSSWIAGVLVLRCGRVGVLPALQNHIDQSMACAPCMHFSNCSGLLECREYSRALALVASRAPRPEWTTFFCRCANEAAEAEGGFHQAGAGPAGQAGGTRCSGAWQRLRLLPCPRHDVFPRLPPTPSWPGCPCLQEFLSYFGSTVEVETAGAVPSPNNTLYTSFILATVHGKAFYEGGLPACLAAWLAGWPGLVVAGCWGYGCWGTAAAAAADDGFDRKDAAGSAMMCFDTLLQFIFTFCCWMVQAWLRCCPALSSTSRSARH